jgi:putative tricarboxylic transport membrane protein
MRSAYKDVVLGIALLAISVFVLVWLIPIGIDSPATIRDPALAPAFWPRLIMIAMTALGVIILLQGLNRIRLLRAEGVVAEPLEPNIAGNLKTAVAAIGLFIFTWTMTRGGIVVPSMVALALYILLNGERRLTIIIPVSIGVPLALYLFFLKVALVPMPLGIFENYFF